MKVKEESEKVSLKLNIQKTKVMASGPITSWQDRLYFGGLQDTADAGRDWGQEEKGMTKDEMAGWHH